MPASGRVCALHPDTGTLMPTPRERFLAKLKAIPPPSDCSFLVKDCQLWTRAKDTKGRPMFSVEGRTVLAYRWAYEQEHGVKLTPEQTLDHRCRRESCCEVTHLEIVSREENLYRSHEYRTF